MQDALQKLLLKIPGVNVLAEQGVPLELVAPESLEEAGQAVDRTNSPPIHL